MTGQGKRILVVEEDEGLKRLCSEVLTVAGYQVELASSGREACGKIREAPYDLVITGTGRPGLDGTGLYLDTLKLYSDMKERFLFMGEDACPGEDASSDSHITKPFNMGELLRKVEALTGVNLTAFLMRYRDFGENRRAERRLCWKEDLRVEAPWRDRWPVVQTVDVSARGMRIRYMGSPMERQSVVTVEARCLAVSSAALVVWSVELDAVEAASGLSLAEPVPASSLQAAARGRGPFVPPLVSGGPRQ